MRLKCEACLVLFLSILILVVSVFSVFVGEGVASEGRELEFEILEMGDISGYGEEAYIVVRTEAEWENVWERHTVIQVSPEPLPEVNFSTHMLVCAFMGKRTTSGYSIAIEGIWDDGETVHVEVTKYSPPEDFVVAQVLTCPYVIVLMERTDLHFIFTIADENGAISEYVLPEFPSILMFITFIAVAGVFILLRKVEKINL